MNSYPSIYITIHQYELAYAKIRNVYACIPKLYTIDYFPIYTHIHPGASPCISLHRPLIPTARWNSAATVLLEPSFLDAIAGVEQSFDLPEQRRRHWSCSLRQIAKALDRPPAVIPARWSRVQIAISQLHHSRIGIGAKTLANHRANAKAALLWFRRERGLPQYGAPLTPEWAQFCERIDKCTRQRLYNLLRYCSARGITPSSVDGTVFDAYWPYRITTGIRATNNTARRFMVRAWNATAAAMKDIGLRILLEPPVKGTANPPWRTFPMACVTRWTATLPDWQNLIAALLGNGSGLAAPQRLRRGAAN